MPASSGEIARRVVAHLLEINCGECSITQEMIAAEEDDVAMAEILTGLLYLHEDLELRDQKRERAEAALRVAKEHAEAATESKSRFLAHMSHEVRTPLTALLGFSDLLIEPDVSEQLRRDYGRIIRRNGQHLLSIINDILDLSKVEAGMLQVEQVKCSLVGVLADVESLMRVRAHEKGLEFGVELATGVPANIISDPTRLRQILLNLIGNAIKFTTSGSVKVQVEFAERPPVVTIEVRDTGIGMSPEQLGQVFDPFRQAGAEMSRRYGGSGLGLAISRSLANALGGDLSAESTEGEGSSFVLHLPLEVPEETTLATSLTATPTLASDDDARGGLDDTKLVGRILLAEDGPDNRLLLRTVLEARGLDVTVVENGQQAVALALECKERGQPFDLILMDMEMPILDGYDATKTLRRRGYSSPIVALTAHTMAGQADRCLQLGCDQFMSKPIDRRALVTMVAAYTRPAPRRR